MDIFITGIIRSGSTLLTKILNNHPDIYVSSDPFFEIYKSFLLDNKKKNKIPDYFFNKNDLELKNKLSNLNFNDVKVKSISKIREKIKKHSYNEIGILEHLEKLDGKNYKKLIESAIKILSKISNKKKLIGTKEAWCSEFIPQLIQQFPKIKIIFLIRDPRAIISSIKNNKNNTKKKLFTTYSIAKQWRKMIQYQQVYKHNDKIKKNILFLKYEDLILDTSKTQKKIIEFLKLRKRNLIKELNFNNSIYDSKEKKISKKNLNIWKNSLTKKEIKFIESILWMEMKINKYKLFDDSNNYNFFNYFKNNNIQSMISKNNMKYEIDRNKYIHDIKEFSDKKLEYLFLNSFFALKIKENLKKLK